MTMSKQKLSDFLLETGGKSNKDIADSIRDVKGLKNPHDNVVLFQEKRSICATAEKLQSIITAFDKDAVLTIKTKKGKWQQD